MFKSSKKKQQLNSSIYYNVLIIAQNTLFHILVKKTSGMSFKWFKIRLFVKD